MSLKFSTYFRIIIFFTFYLVFRMDVEVLPFYVLANLPVLFYTSSWVTRLNIFLPSVFLPSVIMWVFFFPRGLLVMNDPDWFMYPKVDAVTTKDHQYNLFLFFVISSLFLTTIAICLRGFKLKLTGITDASKDFFLRNKSLVLYTMLGFTFFTLFLQVVFNASTYGSEVGLEFISYILPLEYMLQMAIMFLFFYKTVLTKAERRLAFAIIFFSSISGILHASKAAFLNIILLVIICKIIQQGDFKIPVHKAILYVFVLGIPLMGTVILMYIIRSQMQMGLQISYIDLFYLFLDNVSNDYIMMKMVNNFTNRFSCYDGLMITFLSDVQEIKNIYSFKNIFLSWIDLIIPFFSTEGKSLGVSVGYYYSMLPLGFKHAGALGMFGSVMLIGGKFFWLFTIGLGVFLSAMLRIVTSLVKSDAVSLLYTILWINIILMIINSGNFDGHLQMITMSIAHIIFYYMGLRMIVILKDIDKLPAI